MLSKFIEIFSRIVETKSINFGMFHFFGEMNYVYYLSSFLKFALFLSPVIQAYPEQDDTVFRSMCVLTETNLEIINTYFEPDILADIVIYLSNKFQQVSDSSQNDG